MVGILPNRVEEELYLYRADGERGIFVVCDGDILLRRSWAGRCLVRWERSNEYREANDEDVVHLHLRVKDRFTANRQEANPDGVHPVAVLCREDRRPPRTCSLRTCVLAVGRLACGCAWYLF